MGSQRLDRESPAAMASIAQRAAAVRRGGRARSRSAAVAMAKDKGRSADNRRSRRAPRCRIPPPTPISRLANKRLSLPRRGAVPRANPAPSPVRCLRGHVQRTGHRRWARVPDEPSRPRPIELRFTHSSIVEHEGERRSVAAWAERCGLTTPGPLVAMLNSGQTLEQIIC